MNIITSNFKKGQVHLRVTDSDDLWYLSHIIEPGDLVKGKTTRKMKIGDSDNAKVTKKTITLKIEAETIDTGAGATTLRINGKIKEGPEDIPKDSYHSISLEDGSDVWIEKPQWLSYQKQKLKEASEKKFTYLMCIFDREEAIFALTQKQGYEILVKITGDVPKKSKTNTITKDFHQEIIKALETYAGRYQPESIIVASTAFYKDDLYKKITNKDLKKKIVLAICSSVSERALDEVFRRPELAKTLEHSRAREEQLIVEELLAEIDKENLAVYGWDDVFKAGNAGAIKSLIVTDNFIQQKKEDKKYTELDTQMKHVDTLKGTIHIISSNLESGKKVDGIGGIAAILRYKI
ncbi:mRNA surveillance protein pelota [Candidatus Woesearchaeota archaeon]|jgi:protein pelota|nr:mRNA surveillance protein pelota [Candidatus Woesearchaeota archaeon]MBT5397306.1 mRNA surveillance protein pelota [Candidatus Woesearchaeota archaeon]MBT6367849.1 mRNA surveillance protein pelota [Candidatus Woesearchaeota archaeon]MBT7762706.1 mRNA surveillance protein pelota [Candidatus Woesearchaeota archaeon]